MRQAETAYNTGLLEIRQLRERLANERQTAHAAEAIQELTLSSILKDLDMMKSTLVKGRVLAPHDGVVTFIVSEIGSQITAGERVAVVSDLSRFKIMGEIAEGSSRRVNVGSRVTARVGKDSFEGTVTNVTPQSKGGVVSFVISLDNPADTRLKSGLRAELYVTYGYKDDVILLPSGSDSRVAGTHELFVLDTDGRLTKRLVELGDCNREYSEVLSGLQPGDQVVVSDMTAFKSRKSLKIK